MRAILVDPFKHEVREVNDDFNTLKVLQSYLATGTPNSVKQPCMSMGPRLSEHIHTYVDDEGYYRPNQAWFRLRDYDAPLAGYMLVLASTPDGDEADLPPYATPEVLAKSISWTDEQDAAATIPPITITTFDEFGGTPKSYEEIPIDITHKREI